MVPKRKKIVTIRRQGKRHCPGTVSDRYEDIEPNTLGQKTLVIDYPVKLATNSGTQKSGSERPHAIIDDYFGIQGECDHGVGCSGCVSKDDRSVHGLTSLKSHRK